MFKGRFTGELLSWYLQSAHKQRIDLVANHLLKLKYRPAVIQLYLHEWVRFAHHLEQRGLPLPSSVHAPARSSPGRWCALTSPRRASHRTKRAPIGSA